MFFLKAKPKDPFLKKYCNPKKIQGLELQQIKTYGRQILEVLLKILFTRLFYLFFWKAAGLATESGQTFECTGFISAADFKYKYKLRYTAELNLGIFM